MRIIVFSPEGFVIYEYGAQITFVANLQQLAPHPALVETQANNSDSNDVGQSSVNCKLMSLLPKLEPREITFTWTVDGVQVETHHVQHLAWSLSSSNYNEVRIRLQFTPRQLPQHRRKDYVIGCASSNGEDDQISVRVAQQSAIDHQQALTNQELTDRVVPAIFNAESFDDLNSVEEEQLMRDHNLVDSPGVRRVQNGTIQNEPGANMCALSLGLQRKAALIVVDPSAFNKYEEQDFNSMLRHEAVHCNQYLDSQQNNGFWRAVRTVGEVPDDLDAVNHFLMTPLCECEAWLSYLEDPQTSYFFLYHYRAFSQLDDYFWKAGRLIRGMQESGEGWKLASRCNLRLDEWATRARQAFPEISDLLPNDRHYVRGAASLIASV